MFIEALFTMAKVRNQAKCPKTDMYHIFLHSYTRVHTHRNRKTSAAGCHLYEESKLAEAESSMMLTRGLEGRVGA